MHIGVLFHTLGGYHAARLRAAGMACEQRGWKLTAIQVTDATGEHPWGNLDNAITFPVETLLPQRDFPDESLRRFESATAVPALHKALHHLKLQALAIPGWGFPVSRAALDACRHQGIPAILMSESKRDDAPRLAWKEAWKSIRYVRRFDAALVGGNAHREYLVQLGMAAEQIFLGYDVVDNAYFAQGVAIARRHPLAARQRCPAIPQNPYFLAVTRLIPRKNVARLIRAYATYYQHIGPEAWDLVICGSGAEASALQALVRSEGLEGRVHFPGFVRYESLPDWYALAHGFIHPAEQEQWGLVVNEACASGLPILCSQTVGACPELVYSYRNGLVFPPDNASALAQCLIILHRLPSETRTQWGKQSQQIVSPFSPQTFAEGLMGAIAQTRSPNLARR